MALKGVPLWGCAKLTNLHVGVPDLGPRPCGFALNLSRKLDFSPGKTKKWECCSVMVLAQRAITPVEDERPNPSGLGPPGATDTTQEDQSKGFHKDLSLLPSE